MGYAVGYQNLELTISPQINGQVFKQDIELYIWTGQTNTKGKMTSEYDDPIDLKSSVYQETSQNLEHVYGYDITKIYYRFYVQSDLVSGVNRPSDKAQDYIVWKTQRYDVVDIFDGYGTGWKYIIGCLS